MCNNWEFQSQKGVIQNVLEKESFLYMKHNRTHLWLMHSIHALYKELSLFQHDTFADP